MSETLTELARRLPESLLSRIVAEAINERFAQVMPHPERRHVEEFRAALGTLDALVTEDAHGLRRLRLDDITVKVRAIVDEAKVAIYPPVVVEPEPTPEPTPEPVIAPEPAPVADPVASVSATKTAPKRGKKK